MTTGTLHHPPPRARPWPPADRGGATRVVPHLALGLGWTGAAGLLGMWWLDTGSVVGLDGWLTNAGRIAGLLAGYTCAVLLALMARVPLLDHGVGSDRLACAHVLLIIWGYSLTSNVPVTHETVDLVLHYPEMLKATFGFLLLVATG